MKAKLILLRSDDQKGPVFRLNSGVYILGRDRFSNIIIPDQKVSRQHCLLRKEKADYIIKDLDSSNGTYVNGKRIHETHLNFGDEIRIGDSRLLFTASNTRSEDVEIEVVEFIDDSPQEKESVLELPIKNGNKHLIDTNIQNLKRVTEKKALRDLVTIYRVGNVIHSVQDIPKLLNTILDLTFDVVDADVGVLMLFDPQTQQLVPKAFRSRLDDGDQGKLIISHSIAKKVLEGGTAILTTNALSDKRFSTKDSVIMAGIKSAICAPLKGTSKTVGIIYIASHRLAEIFTEADLRLITAIGIQAGIALENSMLFQEKEDLLLGSIRALIASEEARDPYTHGHSVRVASICLAIGKEIGLPEDSISSIELAALLHDTGKLGIPDKILRKPGALNTEEYEVVKMHPVKGEEILKNIRGIEEIAKTVRHHHEWVNGAGYPDGLAGEQISFPSRIISVADAFDAMTSSRPYRAPLTLNETLLEIERNADRQFDGKVVNAFLSIVIQGKLHDSLSELESARLNNLNGHRESKVQYEQGGL